ncbi:MAG: type II toxin-antitoxin system prevent-host-death family antitoxin [Acidobacteria bacterium]|nr:type II toxin-antitoxin system prevent-host-death family antitoxin [Acidobacteriota bacterium]
MRSANIAELRNRLTQYLREVRRGEEIIVRDRQRPIAKIVPFTVDEEDAELQALIAEGLARQPERALPASFWKQRRPNLPVRRVVKAVMADRDER